MPKVSKTSNVSKKYATSSIGYKIIKKYSSDEEDSSSDNESSDENESSYYSDTDTNTESDTRHIKYHASNSVTNKTLSKKPTTKKPASTKPVPKKPVPKKAVPKKAKNTYTTIAHIDYKKPKGGTKQELLTKDEIRQKLKGYKALRTMEDKKYLLKIKPFNAWIRYFNTVTNEFRLGGLLQKVDPQLRYITLINTSNNISWSVQLKDNIIFVPKDYEKRYEEKQRKKQEEITQKEKETMIKEKLYKLYMDGKLTRK
jgi:hypothetical protein